MTDDGVDTEATNSIPDIIDGSLDTLAEYEGLLAAALDHEDERVELVAIEPDAFTVKVNNAETGEFDYLVLDDDERVEQVLSEGASGFANRFNETSEFVFADGEGNARIANGIREGDLESILADVADRPFLNAIDQGETVRLGINGRGGSRDIIIFETDADIPGGAYDDGFSF